DCHQRPRTAVESPSPNHPPPYSETSQAANRQGSGARSGTALHLRRATVTPFPLTFIPAVLRLRGHYPDAMRTDPDVTRTEPEHLLREVSSTFSRTFSRTFCATSQ